MSVKCFQGLSWTVTGKMFESAGMHTKFSDKPRI